MSAARFDALAARGYNRIPLARTRLADFDTPLSAYTKLAGEPYSFLLESVSGGERWGRYSIIGLRCRSRLLAVGDAVTTVHGEETSVDTGVADPLARASEFLDSFKVPRLDGMPAFNGGLVGHVGYDAVRYAEPRLRRSAPVADPLATPDIHLLVAEELVVFDNRQGLVWLIVHVDPQDRDAHRRGLERLNALGERLNAPGERVGTLELPAEEAAGPADPAGMRTNMSRAEYESAVERIREHARQGDVMQVVPSRRISMPFRGQPFDLYRALRFINPSPYLFYFHFGDYLVAGSSPEILVRVQDSEVVVRPLAGTRPRGRDADADAALERELLADEKERAEHLMLIDLGRNDVGRIAESGSVRVTDMMAVERYSHVMHIVSQVSGRLRADLNAIDALRACLPAGTLSGAPKMRAMQIIDELEPVRRGIYGGAVGHLSWHGDMDFAIAIRTAVIKGGEAHVQVGGGIVADSVPAAEWEETVSKSRALLRAVAMAGG